jgi:hypothetical protein
MPLVLGAGAFLLKRLSAAGFADLGCKLHSHAGLIRKNGAQVMEKCEISTGLS